MTSSYTEYLDHIKVQLEQNITWLNNLHQEREQTSKSSISNDYLALIATNAIFQTNMLWHILDILGNRQQYRD